jgi:hypothetical protein
MRKIDHTVAFHKAKKVTSGASNQRAILHPQKHVPT